MHENAAGDATISRSPRFTTEELAAAGAIPEWAEGTNLDDLWNDHWAAILGDEVHDHRAALARLAIVHPAKAGEALGPGWEAQAGVCVWTAPLEIGDLEIWVRNGKAALCCNGDGVFELEPELVAAIARAQLIASAQQRIG